ncbi:protein kinase domain-containing protein [Streptomyces noursei]|uniref:Serine/threonine protein kinase n=1 Tax=Streptomyces noursei TaxID=1971 RepID=A0A2N8PIH4_STRNR|nr:PQQ-binding-like beta-propeller repeat protein [Streptomyces noursei]PNE40780.1 serine/threonine protein kinase [Streptomyces noursei]
MDTPQYGSSDDATLRQPPPQPTLPQPHPSAPQQQNPGRIGPYEVFQLLGEGGMGRVFLARSPGSRLVALKVIRPEYAETPDFRGRFRREADAARKVSGFFTPPVLDADADAPQPWLATAYIPAPSLHDVVRRFGVLPDPALRALGTGLAEALLAIHTAGVVHRDLKPANVLVAEDGPRVIDFGISRAADATQLTRTGTVMGTPGFMAPEQIVSSREAGPAADVFSLGCVLVFAATGQGPFGAGSPTEVVYRAVHAPPQLTGVPDALRPLVTACLDKDPAGRPATTAVLTALGTADPAALLVPGLREDLATRAAHAGVLVTAPPVPVTPLEATAAPSRPSRRRFVWLALAGGAAAAAAGTAALAGGRPKPDGAPGRPTGATIAPGATVPAGPAPQWSHPLRQLQNGQLRLLGDTLVRWDQTTAIGYDAASGAERWTAAPRMPSDVSGKPEWLGVRGSTLFASALGDRGYLLGLDTNGALKFSHTVTERAAGGFPAQINAVFWASGAVALLGTSSDTGYGVCAVDLAAGKVLWSRQVAGSDFHAHSDGRTCFLHDGATLHGLDLRTGTVRWTVRDVLRPGDYPDLTTDGNALLVTSTKVQAFRATDGRTLWTAVDEPTRLNPTTVLGTTAYAVDGQGTVFALDTRSGKQRWHTASPLSLAPAGASDPGPAVSSSLLAYPLFGADTPGFVVLRAADGKVLWAHRASGAETRNKTTAWRVQISGTTLYAASDTTLYAFRSDPR